MGANKVRFNLKNVYYSKLTDTLSAGQHVYSWATPVAIPGAVALNLAPQGDVTPFYADGITYYQSIGNNGYEGDLEVARFPEQMLQDIWGMTVGSTSKVITENSTIEPSPFALLFQIDGDQNNEYYVMYNCLGTRPAIASNTITASKDVQTQSSTISAIPLATGVVHARTTAETPSATKNGWFSAVYQETAASTDCDLSALTVAGVTLSPTFSAGATSYTGNTSGASASITATANDVGAAVSIVANGTSVSSGENYTWHLGANTVKIKVTNGVYSKEYTVIVTKS